MRRETVTVGHKTISYLIAEPPRPAVRQRPLEHSRVSPRVSAAGRDVGSRTWRRFPKDGAQLRPIAAFGRTDWRGSRHTMGDLAGDVVDLLDHLGVTRAAVVGCSMGGYVLFEMLKSAPRYVSAIGLVSTRPGADNEEGTQEPAEDDRAGRSRRRRGDRRADGAEAARRDDAARSAGSGEAGAQPHRREHAASASRPRSAR